MAKMNGCNETYQKVLKPQGVNRISPGSFSRNSMAKGGVNGHAGGTDKFTHKPGLGKSQNGIGKHRQDKR